MKKAIVMTLGVIIGVTGVLAICAHLADAAKLALYVPEDEDDEDHLLTRKLLEVSALSTAMHGSLQTVKNIWTASVRNCHTEQRAAFLFVQSRRTRRSAKQWMISCMTSMARKTRAVKKIII